LTRNDCADWLDAHGLPAPPKSGCIGCPYTSASDWLKVRDEEPESWREAVAFDEQNRHNPLAERAGSTADEIYVWRGVEPLAEVDLEAAARRERKAKQLPLMTCTASTQCMQRSRVHDVNAKDFGSERERSAVTAQAVKFSV
jgi:hypothetical protein